MKTTGEHGFSYLVIGVGLGLLAGLLWAPRRGGETREELSRGAGDGLDYLRGEAGKVRADADRWFAKVKERFGHYRELTNDDRKSATTED